MADLSLISNKEELLHTKMERFDFANPPTDPIALAKTLAEHMITHQGLGLSANQIGLPYRAFVMTGSPIICCFNPMIVDVSEEQILLEEGCLSYPDLFIKIKRPRIIKVRFTMPNGETVTEKYDGMTARIFQHEYDHLEGIDYRKRATRYHLEQARKKRDKWKKLK